MKHYLVIGASSGIGASLTQLLQAQGNKVTGTFHTHPVQSNQHVQYIPYNVLDGDSRLGITEPIDGLIYCPGSIKLTPLTRIRKSDLITDYELQVVGAIKTIQEILPLMPTNGNSSITLISSVAAQTGFPYHTAVSATKGAIEGLVRALSAELAPGIRVNAVAPSLTQTPLASQLLNTPEKKLANEQRHPLKKIGQPQDVASLIAFLASDAAQWITGQIIKVDGGISSLKA